VNSHLASLSIRRFSIVSRFRQAKVGRRSYSEAVHSEFSSGWKPKLRHWLSFFICNDSACDFHQVLFLWECRLSNQELPKSSGMRKHHCLANIRFRSVRMWQTGNVRNEEINYLIQKKRQSSFGYPLRWRLNHMQTNFHYFKQKNSNLSLTNSWNSESEQLKKKTA
jgi:hypothetical protein